MPSVLEPAAIHASPKTLPRPLHLWHLLSLDAPTVAALWTWFIARTVHLALPLTSSLAMFLAVWILYAADRLLDARLLDAHLPNAPLPVAKLPRNGHIHPAVDLEARHLFHSHHRRLFLAGILIAALALAPLLLSMPPEALRLYLITGALLFAWFILIHVSPEPTPQRLPKELAVGIFFAAATFIPTIARQPLLRAALIPPALLFATLCSLNCLFIYAWEHSLATPGSCHPSTRFALAHRSVLCILLLVASLLTALADHPATRLSFAIASSILILCTLDRLRPLSRTGLRVAADLALLTPILFLW